MKDREMQLMNQIRVLYVEDDTKVRHRVGKLLRRRCAEVYEAENGKQGYELYKTCHPDIVITDVAMPVMNGLEMIDHVLGLNSQQCIIITTAYNDAKHRSDKVCKNLIKPIIKEELFEAIIHCLQQRG